MTKPINPTPCARWSGELKAFADGELRSLPRLRLRRHIASCSACNKELKLMQAISQEFEQTAQTEAQPLGADLRARILEAAATPAEAKVDTVPERAQHTVHFPQSSHARKPVRFRFVDFAAVASLLLVVTVFVVTTKGKRLQSTFNNASSAITDLPYEENRAAGIPGEAPAPAVVNGSGVVSSRAKDERASSSLDQESSAVPPPSAALPAIGSTPDARLVHREGNLTVAVDDLEAQSQGAESIVKANGGYLASNSLETGGNGAKTANLDIRVPAAHFAEVIRQISRLGEVKAKSLSGEDLTEQFVGTQAATNSLSTELANRTMQLQAALKRARPGHDPWELRAEVRRLRAEVYASQARQEWLRKSGTLSSLQLALVGKVPVRHAAGFTESLGQTGRDAWASFVDAARLPLQAMIWIAAYSPFWLIGWLIWRKFGRPAS